MLLQASPPAFGQPNQRQWTQKIFKHTNRFQNPLNQNYKHVKVLHELLELKDDQVHSPVVFVGDSRSQRDVNDGWQRCSPYARFIPVLVVADRQLARALFADERRARNSKRPCTRARRKFRQSSCLSP